MQRVRSERGAASVAQTVIVAPTILLVMMVIVQAGLLFHARNVAEYAAQAGAATGRASDGSAAAARDDARAFITGTGDVLRGAQVEATRTEDVARVTVSGEVVSVVPGVHLHVRETESAPVERFVEPGAAR